MTATQRDLIIQDVTPLGTAPPGRTGGNPV
jgi:hypothetical protein